MNRRWMLAALLLALLAAPWLLRRDAAGPAPTWRRGDPVLVIITPHNEAIRYEFARGFSAWHQARYGRPVKVDWRALGGTTEISRYLGSEYAAAARAWWRRLGHSWPAGAADRLFAPAAPDAGDEAARTLWQAFRATDDPQAFSAGVDLLFGGGAYDHEAAARQGLTVAPWPADAAPPGLFATEAGLELIPERLGGETWRSATFFGTALSAFGLCYNPDRLADLHVAAPPAQWTDLAEPAFFGTLGLADPTKSGSMAKAFEMLLQQQIHRAVREADFEDYDIAIYEKILAATPYAPGETPSGIPAAYQEAVERGWLEGLRLVQRLCANARYLSDSASKVPVDVSAGDAAAGLVIDFTARFQAQYSRGRDGRTRLVYVTPVGGTSLSADPISLLRGAAHRATAVRFIEFALSEAGQRLWCYRPGEPGGPARYALCRLPIRRDFYPSRSPSLQARYAEHRRHTLEDLGAPTVDPYALARAFTYVPRWTAPLFGLHRDLIRAMGLDAGEELRAAWGAIVAHGGPAKQAAALRQLQALPARPEPLSWRSAHFLAKKYDRQELLRQWSACYRDSYRRARELVR